MKRIYLIRHLATQKNMRGEMMGQDDSPIAVSEVAEFKQRVLQLGFSQPLLVSSPRPRAIQTAELLGLDDAKIDARLDETDMGDFGGLTAEEIAQKFPVEFEIWRTKPFELTYPGGESLKEVQRRSLGWLEQILAIESNRDIVAVSHADPIKLLIMHALGMDPNLKKYFYIDTGSVSLLQQEGSLLKVKFLNYL